MRSILTRRTARRQGAFALHFALLTTLLLAFPLLAEKKKKNAKPAADPFGDLFGDSLGDNNTNLKDLTKDVNKGKREKGLSAKQAVIKDTDTIKLAGVFAARRIRMHHQRGCEPTDRNRTRIVQITVDEVPVRSPGFAVCLTIESDAHREVRITTSIVSPKNRKIARAESVIDFRGKPILDHIMEFPPVELRRTGQFFYAIDIDGRPAGRLPLFEVVTVKAEEATPTITIGE